MPRKFLLDTNVVSELRKLRPHRAVVAWLRSLPNEAICASAVTIGELQAGVERTRRLDPDKAREIETWIDELTASLEILPASSEVFREWARITQKQPNRLFEDAIVAATARIHQLTVATRNVKDFHRLGVEVLNPFDA